MLTTIRENPERAAFIGVNVRPLRARRLLVAGGFAGLAGALFGIFNRGVFPDFVLLAEVGRGADHDDPRRHGPFLGPGGRRRWCSSCSTSRSSPTPNTGRSSWASILVVLLFVFPGGARRRASMRALAPPRRRPRAMLEVRDLARASAASSRSAACQPDGRAGQIAAVIGPNGAGKIDAVQPDHRASAARQRQGAARRPRHHRHRARTRSAAWAWAARSSAPTSSRKLTVFENMQAAFIVPSRPRREFLVALGAALPRRDRGAARVDRACCDKAAPIARHLSPRQPEAARTGHRAGQRARAPAARRADRRHVGRRDARDDPAARAHRRASAG